MIESSENERSKICGSSTLDMFRGQPQGGDRSADQGRDRGVNNRKALKLRLRSGSNARLSRIFNLDEITNQSISSDLPIFSTCCPVFSRLVRLPVNEGLRSSFP